MASDDAYPPGYERCSWCRGYGIMETWTGGDVDVIDCPHCQGRGMERARDGRGRFVTTRSADGSGRS